MLHKGPACPPVTGKRTSKCANLHRQVSQKSSHEALTRRQFARSFQKYHGRAKEVRQSAYAIGRKGRS